MTFITPASNSSSWRSVLTLLTSHSRTHSTVPEKIKILLEMRPALDGHAGIPQETRLLFRGLRALDDVQVEGLIQSSSKVLAKGLPASAPGSVSSLSADQKINRLSRVVVSLQQNAKPTSGERTSNLLALVLAPFRILLPRLVGRRQKLERFDTTHFRDFIWRSLFAKTLRFEDFDLVTRANFRIARVPWTVMHSVALVTRKLGYAIYPRLATHDFDIMIAETPYPGTVSASTRLIVRYHDAIPVLMPHTISDKSYHQASHYQALRKNVASGAYFSCVSEATRRDLISLFPEAEARSVTIHNMVSHHYFPDSSASAIRVPEIIRTRMHGGLRLRAASVGEIRNVLHDTDSSAPIDYLLIVSTIEPRKNHLTLLAAWEQLRTEKYPNLKLIVVGMLGWDSEAIVKKLRPWVERAQLFVLEDVPSPDLRVLYKHARATVCPSYGEGFDFSGVEAMRCGGAVVASDIPVHREVYAHASEYFSPYSTTALVKALVNVIDPAAEARRCELIANGAIVSEQYLPERILPKWHDYLRAQQADHAAQRTQR